MLSARLAPQRLAHALRQLCAAGAATAEAEAAAGKLMPGSHQPCFTDFLHGNVAIYDSFGSSRLRPVLRAGDMVGGAVVSVPHYLPRHSHSEPMLKDAEARQVAGNL